MENIHAVADADALEDFSHVLDQFRKDLMEKTAELKSLIDSMQSETWDDENYVEFTDRFSKLVANIENINSETVDQNMLPVLREHIEKIRQAKM